MDFQLIYTKRSVKDIQSLDQHTKSRIKQGLEKFRKDPFFYAHKLSNSGTGSYRFRVGNYRIICDIEKHNIIVLRVGHRKNIYRKF